jgi:hypothetical protein
MSCTECGRKGGCSSRKGDMFAALAEILARLHPDRRWGQRDEAAALDAGITPEEGQRLAATIAARLDVATRFVPGEADEWCDYVYVLCLGRAPSVIDLREAGLGEATARVDADAGDADAEPDADLAGDADADPALDDLYLRLALSSVARVVGVQEVAMRLRHRDGQTFVTEDVRAGVFDPILLPRFRALVALLAETDLRHLDFGEMVEPPPGFDGSGYAERFGVLPTVANYLFSPRPVTSRVTTLLP